LNYIGDVLVVLFQASPDLKATKTQMQRSYRVKSSTGYSPIWKSLLNTNEFHFRRLVFTSLKHVYP